MNQKDEDHECNVESESGLWPKIVHVWNTE